MLLDLEIAKSPMKQSVDALMTIHRFTTASEAHSIYVFTPLDVFSYGM
jgi:hypothetical protein